MAQQTSDNSIITTMLDLAESVLAIPCYSNKDVHKHLHSATKCMERDKDTKTAVLHLIAALRTGCGESHWATLAILAFSKELSWNKAPVINLADYTVQHADCALKGFRFRLVHVPSGRTTDWQNYQGVARFTNGVCAVTEYYVGEKHALKPIDDRTFMNNCYGGKDLPL